MYPKLYLLHTEERLRGGTLGILAVFAKRDGGRGGRDSKKGWVFSLIFVPFN
jgi:hypothetical protein